MELIPNVECVINMMRLQTSWVSGFLVLRPTEHKNKYDKVGHYIHWKICQRYKAPYHKNWYERKLESVVKTESVTILWDFVIHTDRKIDANKPITINE